nr:MFS transporter [Nocardioides albus]
MFGLASMGSSSAAVALPAVAEHFDLGLGVVAWTVSIYVLFLAVSTAVYGRVADLVGVRVPLSFGVSLMTAGAVAAAFAPTFEILLLARAFQGAGAAAVPTLGVTLISARYSGSVRGLALGWLAALGAVVSGLGPLLGGITETTLGWRAVMALPLLGLMVLPMLWPILAGGGSGSRLDVLGAVLVAVTSAGLVLLVQSPSTGLAVAGTGAALLLVGGTMVVRHVRRNPLGFLPHAVICNGRVVRPALAAAAAPSCWFALVVAVPAVLVEEGWATWQVGLLLLPGAVLALWVPRLVSRLLATWGGPTVIAISTLFSAVALGVASVGLALSDPLLVGLAAVILAVSFGMGQPALMTTVGETVDADVRGVALGVATLVFLVGGSVGSAAVGGLGGVIGVPVTVACLVLVPALGLLAILVDVRHDRAAAAG